MPTEPSIWSLFVRAAERVPNRDCVVWGDVRRSYADVGRRAAALAGHLKASGLGCRVERDKLADHESGQDHVAILMQNRPEYVETVLGAFAARTVPLNINYRYLADELAQLLEHSGASTLVFEAAFAADAPAATNSAATFSSASASDSRVMPGPPGQL